MAGWSWGPWRQWRGVPALRQSWLRTRAAEARLAAWSTSRWRQGRGALVARLVARRARLVALRATLRARLAVLRARAAELRLPASGGERWRQGRGALRSRLSALWTRVAAARLPAWSWLLVALVIGALVALGWLTWRAERLVTQSVVLQQGQIAAWEVANLQRRLLRLEGAVATANALRKVRDKAVLRGQLERVVSASAVLEREGKGDGLHEVAEWQPLLRRIRRLLARIQADFGAFLGDPVGGAPVMLTGLREVGTLTEELSTAAYTANTRQATTTMATLLTVQRYLAAVQALLVALLLLLVLALWFSLRARLQAAYAQLAAQRAIEADLRQAKEAAEEASRIKSHFLASMSHELRTPLTAMLGFCQLVLRGTYGKVPKRVQEATQHIAHNGEHLLHLVNDVLDLSRIEAGRMELEREACDPAACIQDAVTRLGVLAEQKGLRLEVEPGAALPPRPFDRRRITQVLINLIGNAIKFTEQGSVRVGVQPHAGELRYFVADSGIGIEPERIDSLFVEFQQRDAHIARDAPGAGLGLAISKRLVQLHGGRVWVESQPGNGSTFWFSLPVNEDHGESKEEKSEDSERGGQRAAGPGDADVPGVPGL